MSDRFRGSILVNADDPPAAAREIRRLGEQPGMVQVLMATTTRQPCGQRVYRPLYEAAVEHSLPVALHPGAEGAGAAAAPTPVGWRLLFRRLDPGVRERIMGETAAELYGLSRPPDDEKLPPCTPGPPLVPAGSSPEQRSTEEQK